MRKAVPAGFAASLGLVLLSMHSTALAASFDCNSPTLSQAQTLICQDTQLSRTDEQTARRVRGMSRRLSFGAYLGLRYWHSNWKQQRTLCAVDRPCIAVTYRAQARFLDRLQQCLGGGQRRTCLRNTLNLEREAVRR
jgi:uncharacterized protein